MTIAAINHIVIDDSGVARIGDTRFKVLHLVEEMLARSATVNQLHIAFPSLSMAQIHAALAYYYDHQREIDAQIARESSEFAAERARAAETPGRAKLRDSNHRP